MNNTIDALKSTTFAGRRFDRKQLLQIRQTVKRYRHLSLRELGHTLCEHLNWVTPGGKHRIQTCLRALEEMQVAGLFQLPEKHSQAKKAHQKPIQWREHTAYQVGISGTLDQFTAIRVEPVTEADVKSRFNEYVDRYHYLGYRKPIGNHLRYFIIGQNNQGDTLLGCLLFSFAVNHLACRDNFIGWNDLQREKHLPLLINNTRFLIFPWVNIKNLASRALSTATKRVANDWLTRYGLQPLLIETFVDPKRFTGACYKAANWRRIGLSAGRKASKNHVEKTPKTVFVHPLRKDYKTILTQNRVWLRPSRKRRPLTAQNTATERPGLTEDDPFVHLWQRVIMLLSTVAEEFDAQWRQRRRVIGTLLLMLFVFRLVFSKNKQGYAATVNELWAQCRDMKVVLPQTKPVAASAFCKARKKLNPEIFKTLNTRIIENYEQHTLHHWHGRRLFAVDGCKINLPRPLRDEDYRLPSDNANYPQGLLSCLYQLKSKIPCDFDLSPSRDERKMALAHLKTLQAGDVVVYDRGYFSYAMLYTHQLRGVDVVFRMPKRKGKAIDAFMASDATDAIVDIEVTASRQQEVQKKHPYIAFKPLPLRLIKYEMGGNAYTLGTTLLERNAFPEAIFPDLYHQRWGIEELYKISKELLQVGEFHAHTERGIKQELFAHFVLLTLNRILANHTEAGLNAGQESAPGRPRFQVNIKNALITMARHVEELFLAHTHLTSQILNTLIDAYGFCRQKTRPGRKYPRVSMKPVGKWRASKI